jgi:4-hydroxy-3-methylbut-2-enyl diphosphate reductase
MNKRILLASPRGFCLGVSRALKMLDDTLERERGTVYVRKEIVHNTALTEHYKSRGVVVADEADDVPRGRAVVFSAHGVAPSVRERARERNLRVVDATCPLVARLHNEAVRLREQGYTIILIGEIGHKEVIGVVGEAPDNIRVVQNEADIASLSGAEGSRLAWLSQTTLNADDTRRLAGLLREKYPLIKDPPQECVCHAARERQLAVKGIAGECDLFIAVGSPHSSNTKRLAEVASASGARAALRVDTPEELEGADFSAAATVGVASGVSAAESQLAAIIAYLGTRGYTDIEERGAAGARPAAFGGY